MINLSASANTFFDIAQPFVKFDDLIGVESIPASLFTCGRHHRPQSRPRKFNIYSPAGSGDAVSTTPTGHERVAIGMPVSAHWLMADATDARSLTELCEAGKLLACARATWMGAAGAGLGVLLLADCLRVDEKAAARYQHQHRSLHAPFEFPIAPWLLTPTHNDHDADGRPRADVSVECYWGAYMGFALSYRKTATLVRAMVERFGGDARRRWYIKASHPALAPLPTFYLSPPSLPLTRSLSSLSSQLDADAILRPNNLMHFLRSLEASVASIRTTPLYFGSHHGAQNCQPFDQANICKV